jgi:glycosyltransferase involved in cell wall biosynthesis
MTAPSLAIILPAYNEANGILACVENIARMLDELHLALPIIVVDDGSKDHTYTLLLDLQNRMGKR